MKDGQLLQMIDFRQSRRQSVPQGVQFSVYGTEIHARITMKDNAGTPVTFLSTGTTLREALLDLYVDLDLWYSEQIENEGDGAGDDE